MSQKTKRVFTRKSKLFLILASMILALSCKNPLRDESGGSGGSGGGGGSSGGQTITNEQGKVFPAWYLTAEEQGKELNMSQTLFYSTGTPAQHYRIPAIIVADNGNIVAICDNRHTKHGDIGQTSLSDLIDIVYKISKDGGKTWSAEKIILPKTTKNDPAIANNKGDALVFKANDGTLVVLAVSGGGYAAADSPNTPSRMLRSESRDNGETWSLWQEVGQDLFEKIKKEHGRKRGFATSGRGLTLKDGTFAAGLSVDGSQKGQGITFVYAYSKDKGRTWNYAGFIPGTDNTVTINEPKPIAQLEDGRVLTSVRNAKNVNGGNNNPRLYAIFNADGTSMPNKLSKWNFHDGSVDAEGVVWTRKSAGHDITRILHIQAGPYGRKGLKLYLSKNEEMNWQNIRTILNDNTRACYASMDVAGDGTVITLAEEQTRDNKATTLQYDIVFRRYNMFDLTKEVYKTEWYKEIKTK